MRSYGYSTSFLDQDTETRSYFLGLVMSDGWLDQQGAVRIGSSDRQLIDTVVEMTQYTNRVICCHPVSPADRSRLVRPHYVVSYRGPIRKKMEEFGFVVNKTGNEFIPPCVSDETFSHFLRGVSDGDGCLCLRYDGAGTRLLWQLTAAGTDWLDIILARLRVADVVTSSHVKPRVSKSGVASFLLGHYDSCAVAEFMYNGANFFLRRKFAVALEGCYHGTGRTSYRWTAEEDDLVRKGILPAARSRESAIRRAQTLGLSAKDMSFNVPSDFMVCSRWTEEEDRLLLTGCDVPGRSTMAMVSRRRKLRRK